MDYICPKKKLIKLAGATLFILPYSPPTQEKRRLSHSHLLPGQNNSSPVRDFFTVLALSFHAVFEGLAVGLEEVDQMRFVK